MNQKAIVKKVIVTDLTTRGKGVEGDPMRTVTQFWDLDGTLLAEIDLSEEISRLEAELERARHINNQFRAQLDAIAMSYPPCSLSRSAREILNHFPKSP